MKYDTAARVSFLFIQPLRVYCVIDCVYMYILVLLVRCGFLTIMNLYCTVTIPYHVQVAVY